MRRNQEWVGFQFAIPRRVPRQAGASQGRATPPCNKREGPPGVTSPPHTTVLTRGCLLPPPGRDGPFWIFPFSRFLESSGSPAAQASTW